MRHSVLPVLAVLTVIAGAVGLQLGESAIAQIDPLYFQGPAPEPIDKSKPAPAPASPAYASASGWAEGYAARAEDCGDCDLTMVDTAPASPRARAAYERPAAPVEPEDTEMVMEEMAPEPSAQSQLVRRYVDYPINADQARIRAALDRGTASAEPDGL